MREDVRPHLRVPATTLMPEVNSRFKQGLHGYRPSPGLLRLSLCYLLLHVPCLPNFAPSWLSRAHPSEYNIGPHPEQPAPALHRAVRGAADRASRMLTCGTILVAPRGDIAQLGERGFRNAEVGGSTPPISTTTPPRFRFKSPLYPTCYACTMRRSPVVYRRFVSCIMG